MAKDKSSDKESRFDRFYDLTRRKSLLLANTTVGYLRGVKTIYLVVQIVGFLQLVSFSMNIKNKSHFDAPAIKYIKMFLGYLSFGDAPQLSRNTLFGLLLTGVILTLGFTVAFGVITAFFVDPKKPIRSLVKVFLRTLALYVLVFDAVLILPLVQLSAMGFVCKLNIEAYSETLCATTSNSNAVLACGSILLVSSIAGGVYFKLLFNSIDPMSLSPITAFDGRYSLLKMMVKVPVGIYQVLFPRGDHSIYMLSAVTCLFAFVLVMRVRSPPEPIYSLSFVHTGFDFTQLAVAISCLVVTAREQGKLPDNLSFIYLIVFILLAIFYVYYGEFRRIRVLINKDLSKLENEDEINRFIFTFTVLVNQCLESDAKQELHYALKLHYDQLIRQGCLDEDYTETLRCLLTESNRSSPSHQTPRIPHQMLRSNQ
jgi:hypothetical protein